MASRTKERKTEARETVPMDQARDTLTELVNRASYADERILIARNGTPVAAIIGLADLALLDGMVAKAS